MPEVREAQGAANDRRWRIHLERRRLGVGPLLGPLEQEDEPPCQQGIELERFGVRVRVVPLIVQVLVLVLQVRLSHRDAADALSGLQVGGDDLPCSPAGKPHGDARRRARRDLFDLPHTKLRVPDLHATTKAFQIGKV